MLKIKNIISNILKISMIKNIKKYFFKKFTNLITVISLVAGDAGVSGISGNSASSSLWSWVGGHLKLLPGLEHSSMLWASHRDGKNAAVAMI